MRPMTIAPRLDAITAAQSEIAGRFAQALDGQSALQNMLAERIEALDRRLGESLKDTATKTAETLGGIQTRLTVIDEAQKNISALSGTFRDRSSVFRKSSPTSSRAAFSARRRWKRSSPTRCRRASYEFQATLSNGKPAGLRDPPAGHQDGHRHRFEISAGIVHGFECGGRGRAENRGSRPCGATC